MNTIVKQLCSAFLLLISPFYSLANESTWIYDKIFRFDKTTKEYTDLNQIVNYLEQNPIKINDSKVYIGDLCSYAYTIDNNQKYKNILANLSDADIPFHQLSISNSSERSFIVNNPNDTDCDSTILNTFGSFYKFENKLLFRYNNHLFSYTIGDYIPSNRFNKDDIAVLPRKYPYLCANALINKAISWCKIDNKALLHKVFYNPVNLNTINVIKIIDPNYKNISVKQYIVVNQDQFGYMTKIFEFRNNETNIDFYYKNDAFTAITYSKNNQIKDTFQFIDNHIYINGELYNDGMDNFNLIVETDRKTDDHCYAITNELDYYPATYTCHHDLDLLKAYQKLLDKNAKLKEPINFLPSPTKRENLTIKCSTEAGCFDITYHWENDYYLEMTVRWARGFDKYVFSQIKNVTTVKKTSQLYEE